MLPSFDTVACFLEYKILHLVAKRNESSLILFSITTNIFIMENRTVKKLKKNRILGLKHVTETYLGEWKLGINFITTPQEIS